MGIYINKGKVSEENLNSVIFLRYLEYYGVDFKYYHNILELFQTVEGSMSQFLRNYNQYLLSKNLTYEQLSKFNLQGGYGDFENGNICISRSLKSGEYNSLCNKIPNINEFDIIIGNGISSNLKELAYTEKIKFLGVCMDSNNKNKRSILKSYKLLTEIINLQGGLKYSFEKDTIAAKQKTLCIVRPK